MELDLELLDRFHWRFANAMYEGGKRTKNQTFDRNFECGFLFACAPRQHEILFDEDIDLNATSVKIWVPFESTRSNLIARLRAAGIKEAFGKSPEQLIRVLDHAKYQLQTLIGQR